MTDVLGQLKQYDENETTLSVEDMKSATEDFSDTDRKEVIQYLEDGIRETFNEHIDTIYTSLCKKIVSNQELNSGEVEQLQLCGYMKQKYQSAKYEYPGEAEQEIIIDGKGGEQTQAIINLIKTEAGLNSSNGNTSILENKQLNPQYKESFFAMSGKEPLSENDISIIESYQNLFLGNTNKIFSANYYLLHSILFDNIPNYEQYLNYFQEIGIPLIDPEQISKSQKITEEVIPEIIQYFEFLSQLEIGDIQMKINYMKNNHLAVNSIDDIREISTIDIHHLDEVLLICSNNGIAYDQNDVRRFNELIQDKNIKEKINFLSSVGYIELSIETVHQIRNIKANELRKFYESFSKINIIPEEKNFLEFITHIELEIGEFQDQLEKLESLEINLYVKDFRNISNKIPDILIKNLSFLSNKGLQAIDFDLICHSELSTINFVERCTSLLDSGITIPKYFFKNRTFSERYNDAINLEEVIKINKIPKETVVKEIGMLGDTEKEKKYKELFVDLPGAHELFTYLDLKGPITIQLPGKILKYIKINNTLDSIHWFKGILEMIKSRDDIRVPKDNKSEWAEIMQEYGNFLKYKIKKDYNKKKTTIKKEKKNDQVRFELFSIVLLPRTPKKSKIIMEL